MRGLLRRRRRLVVIAGAGVLVLVVAVLIALDQATVADLLLLLLVLGVGALLRRQGIVQARSARARATRLEQLVKKLAARPVAAAAPPSLSAEDVAQGLDGSRTASLAADLTSHAISHQQHLDAVTSALYDLNFVLRQVHARTSPVTASTERRHTVNQVQALLDIDRQVGVGGALLGGWALSPDALSYVLQLVRSRHPRTIVECGSGASTLQLAATQARLERPARIISLEHDAEFAAQTVRRLEAAGLAHLAEVRVAPIEPVVVQGSTIPWYSTSALDGIDDIDLLLVDGPPADLDPMVRYPALPLLKDRLGPSCVVLLDDTIRQQEKDVAARWSQESPEFEVTALDLEKGMIVLWRGEPLP